LLDSLLQETDNTKHFLAMASYHKPKVFRSVEGCCICKAKSSSSRFTDSEKYENSFATCFQLSEATEGEICNACVLIVKRWRMLPQNTKKNWAHVVNSRIGNTKQNTKKVVIQTKETEVEKFKKIRRKHRVLFKKPKVPLLDKESMTKVPGFIDLSYWTRSVVCCGVVYLGQAGEVMVDQQLYSRCPAHRLSPPAVQDLEDSEGRQRLEESNKMVGVVEVEKSCDEDSDSLSLYSDTDSHASSSKPAESVTFHQTDTDTGDEGFYDKTEMRLLI